MIQHNTLQGDWDSVKMLHKESRNETLLMLFPVYFANIFLQFLYYKVLIYIIYGKVQK